MPKATLATLAKNKAKLKAVLLYHVAAGSVTAAKVVKLKSVKTLKGHSVAIRVSGGKVYVGGARVIKTNVDRLQRRDPRNQQGADPAQVIDGNARSPGSPPAGRSPVPEPDAHDRTRY